VAGVEPAFPYRMLPPEGQGAYQSANTPSPNSMLALAGVGGNQVFGPSAEVQRMLSGFSREGVLRSHEPVKGQRPDLVSWSLLPGEPRPGTDRPRFPGGVTPRHNGSASIYGQVPTLTPVGVPRSRPPNC